MDEHDLRLYWKKAQGSKTIHFNYTPFLVKESNVLDCQFALSKNLQKESEKHTENCTHRFVLYPEFAVSEAERENLSNWNLRCLQEERL